jgi:hypothetical protein
MVQLCIEEIGVPTVERYKRAAKKIGWSLTGPPSDRQYRASDTQNLPLIPRPVNAGESYFVFRGRGYGILDDVLSTTEHNDQSLSIHNQHLSPSSDPMAPIGSGDEYGSNGSNSDELLNYIEECAHLQTSLNESEQCRMEAEQRVADLEMELQETAALLAATKQTLAKINSQSSRQKAQHSSSHVHRADPPPLSPSSSPLVKATLPLTPLHTPIQSLPKVQSQPSPIDGFRRFRIPEQLPFGPATEEVVKRYGLDHSIHLECHKISSQIERAQWLGSVLKLFENSRSIQSQIVAADLTDAMAQDRAARGEVLNSFNG